MHMDSSDVERARAEDRIGGAPWRWGQVVRWRGKEWTVEGASGGGLAGWWAHLRSGDETARASLAALRAADPGVKP